MAVICKYLPICQRMTAVSPSGTAVVWWLWSPAVWGCGILKNRHSVSKCEGGKKNQYNHPETTVLFSLCCDWLTLSKCRMSENSPAHLKWQIIKLYLPTCFAYIHRFILYYLQTVCLTLKCYDEMHAEGAKRHARRQEVVNTKSMPL